MEVQCLGQTCEARGLVQSIQFIDIISVRDCEILLKGKERGETRRHSRWSTVRWRYIIVYYLMCV